MTAHDHAAREAIERRRRDEDDPYASAFNNGLDAALAVLLPVLSSASERVGFGFMRRHCAELLSGGTAMTTPELSAQAIREAALEEAAKVADNWNLSRPDRVTENNIAAAIRALSAKEAGHG